MPRSHYIPLLLATFILSACTTNMHHKKLSREAIQTLDVWQAKGKLGISSANNSHSVNFNWKNNKDEFDIQLYGALGLGRVSLKQSQGKIRLNQGNKIKIANSPEELLQESLGWNIPVQELNHWIKGVPSPLSPKLSETYNNDGSLASLTQNGWQLTYLYYDHSNYDHSNYDHSHRNKGHNLPRKIIARREHLKLVIVIKTWQF